MNNRVLTILGTRPEIIRLSAILPKLDQVLGRENHFVLHTGQNYTAGLSDIFFQQLNLRQPDLILQNQNTTTAQQIANTFVGVENAIKRFRPTRALILGDTNSALSAIICERMGVPVYHMEAGNRCYDLSVPEERNRRVIDAASTYNLPYTELSRQNLLREGLPNDRITVVGNPIQEVIELYQLQINCSDILQQLNLISGQYLVVTAHRAENVDDPLTLQQIFTALQHISQYTTVVFSCHPRTRNKINDFGISTNGIQLIDPLGFFDFVHLEQHSQMAITDSGTVQEEMCLFGIPTVTIRNTTERPETVWCGSNIISGLNYQDIVNCYNYFDKHHHSVWQPPAEYVKPNVSDTVVKLLISNLVRQ